MPAMVHRTARIALRLTRRQRARCFEQLYAGGDVWAWVVGANRERRLRDEPPVADYLQLCQELTARRAPFRELSMVGARSVLKRYSTSWSEAARRQQRGERAEFPRRKRSLMPIRFHHGVFQLQDRKVRLPAARGTPELLLRLAREVPYPVEAVRAVTLLAEGGRLYLDVTALLPARDQGLDPARVAGVDVGIIHPFAVVGGEGALLVSGRAVRAEERLHLADSKARQRSASRKAPRKGQRGSRRWKRYRAAQRRAEARHRRRVRQAQHEAATAVVQFAVERKIGTLVVGDPKGITTRDAGRRQNRRLRSWRRTHLLHALQDKAELAGIQVKLVNERGTSSTCPECRQPVSKPPGRILRCSHCHFRGHRDLAGARNIAAIGGGITGEPSSVTHRRAGHPPARRDRRRQLFDRDQRRRFCPAPGPPPQGRASLVAGHPPGWSRQAAGLPDGEDRASRPARTMLEGALPPQLGFSALWSRRDRAVIERGRTAC